jgi:hypothetical protein
MMLFCGRLVAGIEGSNTAEGMDVCVLCLCVVLSCVGRGLCDGLITRPEEFYRVSNCVWLRNLNIQEDKAHTWAVVAQEKNDACIFHSMNSICVLWNPRNTVLSHLRIFIVMWQGASWFQIIIWYCFSIQKSYWGRDTKTDRLVTL